MVSNNAIMTIIEKVNAIRFSNIRPIEIPSIPIGPRIWNKNFLPCRSGRYSRRDESSGPPRSLRLKIRLLQYVRSQYSLYSKTTELYFGWLTRKESLNCEQAVCSVLFVDLFGIRFAFGRIKAEKRQIRVQQCVIKVTKIKLLAKIRRLPARINMKQIEFIDLTNPEKVLVQMNHEKVRINSENP